MNYFKLLEIEPTNSKQAIKDAYRKMAKKYHPDTNHNPDSEQKFKEISEAYNELIKDSYVLNKDDFSSTQPNNDLKIYVNIDINDIFKNEPTKLIYNYSIICDYCTGTGLYNPKKCETCNGNGYIDSNIDNFFSFPTPCNDCAGSKFHSEADCSHCNKTGTYLSEDSVELKNISDLIHSSVFFDQKGNQDKNINAPRSSLYVFGHLKLQNLQINHNGDVFIQKEIDILNMITENEIKIDGLNNEIHMLKLINNQNQYIILNAGIPKENSRTNLHVSLKFKNITIKDQSLNNQIKSYLS